jgi:LacI family gluconate utilization system Gnt-I transcriptional repressor
MEEVARAAGVSAQTVSRVLRTPDSVGPVVRARVTAAIAAVGYVPNLVAGALASNRSQVVAIVVPTLANSVHAAPVQGLSDALRGAAYEVLVGTTDYDRARERALVRAFLGRRVDGLVIIGGELDPQADAMLRAAGLPTVQLWELPDDPVDMAAGVHNAEVGVAVARHVAARGHQHLAVIGHAAAADTRSAARVAGFRREASRLGLPPPLLLTAERPADLAAGAAHLGALRTAWPRPQAVFCAGDQLAVGVIMAANRARVAVPDALAVVGVGDSDLAALVSPALTTVRMPRYEMGRTAGEMLLTRFAGERVEPRCRDLGFQLVLRESG